MRFIRPVAIFRHNEGDLAAHLAGQFAKHWMPDAYLFIEQIPRTSTGKYLKQKLRADYGDILEKRLV